MRSTSPSACPLLHYDTDTEAVVQEATALVEELAPHPRLASRGLAILFSAATRSRAMAAGKSGDDYARLVALRCAADAASSEALAARPPRSVAARPTR